MTRTESQQQTVPLGGSTVTAAYYRKFLQDVLHPKIRQKRSTTVTASVLISHNNVWPHASGAVSEILEKYEWQMISPPAIHS
jgi:hypothetical protein